MALRAVIESIEGLPADVSKEYKKEEKDGKTVYVLDIEGAEDVGALKRAKDHEKNLRKEAEKKVTELTSLQEKLQEEMDEMRRGNIPKGDVEKLEASHKEKFAKLQKEKDDAIAVRDTTLRSLLVDNVAQKIAGEISNAPALMIPLIKSRLTTEVEDGKFVTKVLGSDGKPSSLSIEELQKELVADKQFAPIIVASRASGSGAAGSGRSGAPGATPPSQIKDLSQVPASEYAKDLERRRKAAGKE